MNSFFCLVALVALVYSFLLRCHLSTNGVEAVVLWRADSKIKFQWSCPDPATLAKQSKQIRKSGWGPAVPAEIWSSWLRVEWRMRRNRRKRRRAACKNLEAFTWRLGRYAFAREHRGFFSRCSAKARESGFQTHGRRERKTLHRERFAKEIAKGKTE